MKNYSLNGSWLFKAEEETEFQIPREFVEATVPGTVMGICFEKGLIPDPFYRENELTVLPLFDHD